MIKAAARVVLLGLALAYQSSPASAADVRVAVTAIVDHPALDAARKGVSDELADAGYVVGKNLKLEYQSAQGNAATYTYDAVGNLLRVDRFDAAQQPGPVRITLVTPTEGKVRTFATIR